MSTSLPQMTLAKQIGLRRMLLKDTAAQVPVADLPDPLAETRWQEFMAVGAASGAFDPSDFFTPDDPEKLRRTVLARALRDFTVERTLWRMLPGPRVAFLQSTYGGRPMRARDIKRLPPTDDYGRLLRRVLQQGADFSLRNRSQESLRHLRMIVDDLAGSGLPTPSAEAIQRLIEAGSFEREFLGVAKPFVGRKDQLKELHRFLEHPPSAAPGQWDAMLVTGLGGSGKSALLTRFLLDVYRARSATIVVLDFDRPGIDPGDTVWLRAEIARQVGMQYPEASDTLRTSRRHAREDQMRLAGYGSFERSSNVNASDTILMDVSMLLHSGEAPAKAMVMVFDTLEAVAAHPSLTLLPSFLDQVNDLLSLPLKVLLVGRAFGETFGPLVAKAGSNKLHLDELSPASARQLLGQCGVPRVLAQRLAEVPLLPLRPLELHLLAREARDGRLTAETLAKELEEGGGAELAAGIIFRRTLRRLPEGLVQTVACPGLVLREITPAAICEVLAPALDLGEISEPEARAAFDQLAGQAWLVTRLGPDRVRHRPDLRRSMLKLMITEKGSKARRVSEAAVRAYASSAPAEALYHTLLWLKEPASAAVIADLKAYGSAIVPDIDDLPPYAAVALKYTLGLSLTPGEIELLPDREFQVAYGNALLELCGKRGYGVGLRLMKRFNALRGKEPRNLETIVLEDLVREVALAEYAILFATAEWDELSRIFGEARRLVDQYEYFYRHVIGKGNEVDDGFDINTKLPKANFAELDRASLVMAMILSSQGKNFENGYELFRKMLESKVDRSGRKTSLLGLRLQILVRILKFNMDADSDFNHDNGTFVPRLLPLTREIVHHPVVQFYPNISGAFAKLYEDLEAQAVKGRLTTRSALSAIDRVVKAPEFHTPHSMNGGNGPVFLSGGTAQNIRGVFKMSDSERAALLRGPDMEYRDPVRFALMEAFPKRPDWVELAAVLQAQIDLSMNDLAPDTFADAMALDAEHVLVAPVELIDRAWRLGPLLGAAVVARPNAPKLGLVKASFDRWDRIVSRALHSASGVNGPQ